MLAHGRCRLLTALAFCAAAAQVSANPRGGQTIAIANHGFEANSVSPGCFAVFVPSGWSLYDPNGIHDGNSDAVGGLYPAGGPYFPSAPEGNHVALVFLAGDIGGGPVGLRQTLSEPLTANTTYTLTVQIGNIASGQGPPPCDVFGFFNLDGFPGYRVQLLAGGVVVAEDNNSLAATIPEGEFRLSTIQANIGATHPQLGAPLELRLINLNTPGTPMSPGIEVDFDDVQLTTGCPATGDIDADSDVDGNDAVILAGVLVGADTDPTHVTLSDVDCSNALNGEDIARWVALLLE